MGCAPRTWAIFHTQTHTYIYTSYLAPHSTTSSTEPLTPLLQLLRVFFGTSLRNLLINVRINVGFFVCLFVPLLFLFFSIDSIYHVTVLFVCCCGHLKRGRRCGRWQLNVVVVMTSQLFTEHLIILPPPTHMSSCYIFVCSLCQFVCFSVVVHHHHERLFVSPTHLTPILFFFDYKKATQTTTIVR